jgi:hypothetical protein
MILARRFGALAFCLMAATNIAPVIAHADEQEQPKPSVPSIDSRFIGHYYLSGVMETGSEMLLKPDGSYDWMMTYGAVDLFSKGTWSRVGDQIVLTPTPPDKSAAPFTIVAVEPWNEEAEENAQEAAMVERNSAKIEQCRFQKSEAGGYYIDAAMSPPYLDVTPAVIAAAKDAEIEEFEARRAYENAAVAAMAEKDDASHSNARQAKLNWRRARDHMRQAQSDARLPSPHLDEPKLPAECVLEDWPLRPGDIPRESWIGGVAVHVGDAEREMYFNEVPIRFGFESGATLMRETESGGIAWVPRNAGDRVTSITVIGKKDELPQEYPFQIDPISEGCVSVNFISGAYESLSFTQMSLKIKGDDLAGLGGRGTYSRPQRTEAK